MTGAAIPVSAATRVMMLLGDPVAHSLSPRIHNAAMRALGLDGVYVACRCAQSDAGALLRAIAHAGGAGNVTVPHKNLTADVLDRRTEPVLRTGACNTFWLEDGFVCGDNTDVAGFVRAVATLRLDLSGARVLLLGAGGAARAVVAALHELGADRVDILNRSATRAAGLTRAFAASGIALHTHTDLESLRGETFALAVNATSLGLAPDDALPCDLSGMHVGAAMDLVYGSADTPWITMARSLGIPSQDGRTMLLHQAAAAFERWWNIPAPLDVMHRALTG